MRTTRLLTTAALLRLGACASAVSVRTAVSPAARLSGPRTFRVLPTPQPKIAAADSSTSDPMLVNSISNRALRADLTEEARVPNDEAEYERELKQTVTAIVETFPGASGKVALAHGR